MLHERHAEGEAGCLTNDNDEFLMFELPKLMQNACHEFLSFTIVFRAKRRYFCISRAKNSQTFIFLVDILNIWLPDHRLVGGREDWNRLCKFDALPSTFELLSLLEKSHVLNHSWLT